MTEKFKYWILINLDWQTQLAGTQRMPRTSLDHVAVYLPATGEVEKITADDIVCFCKITLHEKPKMQDC